MTPAETVSRWAMFLDKPIEVEDAIAALVKAERERATPAPVRAEGEARLREALEEIKNPIAAMKRRAEAAGGQLARNMAFMLANDPNYLKEIARAALKAEDSLHG